MRLLVLVIVFILSVALMTAGWWGSIYGQGAVSKLNFPAPLAAAVVATFILHMVGFNSLCAFSVRQKVFLRVGLPVSTTLIVLAFGNLVDLFLPAEKDQILNVAMALVTIGIPSFVLGSLVLFICCISWIRSNRIYSGEV